MGCSWGARYPGPDGLITRSFAGVISEVPPSSYCVFAGFPLIPWEGWSAGRLSTNENHYTMGRG